MSNKDTLITVRHNDAGKLLDALENEDCEVLDSDPVTEEGVVTAFDYTVQGVVSEEAKAEIAKFALHTYYRDEN